MARYVRHPNRRRRLPSRRRCTRRGRGWLSNLGSAAAGWYAKKAKDAIANHVTKIKHTLGDVFRTKESIQRNGVQALRELRDTRSLPIGFNEEKAEQGKAKQKKDLALAQLKDRIESKVKHWIGKTPLRHIVDTVPKPNLHLHPNAGKLSMGTLREGTGRRRHRRSIVRTGCGKSGPIVAFSPSTYLRH